MNEISEMTNEQKETDKPETETADGELNAACWSVVTFEECAAKNLTYAQAETKLRELAAQKFSGLCIITDEAAARIGTNK